MDSEQASANGSMRGRYPPPAKRKATEVGDAALPNQQTGQGPPFDNSYHHGAHSALYKKPKANTDHDAANRRDPPTDATNGESHATQMTAGLIGTDKNTSRINSQRTAADPDGLVASRDETIDSASNVNGETIEIPPLASSAPIRPARKDTVAPRQRTTTDSLGEDGGISPITTRKSKRNNGSETETDVISSLLPLPELSESKTLDPLTSTELSELEKALELTDDDGWRADWSGNLAFTEREVTNPKKTRNGNSAGTFTQSLYIWAQKDNPAALRQMYNLFRYVYHLEDTPPMAKKILANADRKDGIAMEQAFRRVTYDPKVLRQDGWTTAKAPKPMGATGGAYRIGEHVRWQGSDAVVIAYVHDPDLGDLWRGIWLDEGGECFDMEAEELVDARKKWERRAKSGSSSSSQRQRQNKEDQSQRRSHRYNSANEVKVEGVEDGIVLAASFARGARPGVYWPARVMHASEAANNPGGKNKRGAPRQRLDLVFLAPYWNSQSNAGIAVPATSNRRVVESFSESLSRHGESLFNTGPLFDVESVDVTEDMIKEYPYNGRDGRINVDQLRVAFRFTGLPKAAFPRFLDSHRLALALKTYAQQRLPPRTSDQASAGLFETHPMSVSAPIFPPEVLHLPYVYILSQLPLPSSEQFVNNGEQTNVEPILQINAIVEAMKPPLCWGQERTNKDIPAASPTKRNPKPLIESPHIDIGTLLHEGIESEGESITLDHFTKDLFALTNALEGSSSDALEAILQNLQKLLRVASVKYSSLDKESRRSKARAVTKLWALAKFQGEEAIGISFAGKSTAILSDWRRACEKVYKYITHAVSTKGFGNGVSVVLSDYRCNQHVTSCGCFERAVRLPAALRAARDMGAGHNENIPLLTTIEKCYVDAAENDVLLKAHSISYLRRMKSRCSQIRDNQVAYLTEDSDGNGGEDTKGSRGTWTAAVTCVGAAIKAVDMVVFGECVNVFCATRPPGHHAGRDLHPMKAISNGFCILNAAACAALHATTTISEGGPGLRRVCVIDFDVHHGNGTQDILCSTYDPRFLYVSMHAGGAHVNGLPPSGDELENEIHSPGGSSQKKGIYPGRCGDTSPHKGVLNIPLGPRVTSHAIGTALINQVTPAVDNFCPDLIILSTGFDGHKNDPLGLGGLSAEDFGHITDVACQMAFKCCSGRLVSIMEGGYGVPCCRPQKDLFLPKGVANSEKVPSRSEAEETNAVKENVSIPNSGTNTNQETNSKSDNGMANPNTAQQPVDAPRLQHSDAPRPQPSKLLELGEDLPSDMDDQVPYALQRRLEKCHAEGFMECVRGHVKSLSRCNSRS